MLEFFMRLKWEVRCQNQTIFLVSTHSYFLLVLDQCFRSNTHGLCCCTGKNPERIEFQCRVDLPRCHDLFLLPLEVASFSFLFFFFYFAHERKNVSGTGETSKILRAVVSCLDFLESPGGKRANDSSSKRRRRWINLGWK